MITQPRVLQVVVGKGSHTKATTQDPIQRVSIYIDGQKTQLEIRKRSS